MKNKEQLLNKENWLKYLELAKDGELTNNAIANDIVAMINKALTIPVVVGQSEQLRFLIDKFQTPKGNYLIDLLMEHKESKEKP